MQYPELMYGIQQDPQLPLGMKADVMDQVLFIELTQKV